ncbi:MAG: cytochrome c biogenesis protein CcsA [Pirellulales bacterium]
MLHTVALIFRIYLSGRPPVTNLYSSALFIGWGIVALALAIEAYTRQAFGVIAAGFAGFFSLLISNQLFGDTAHWSGTGGDTMGVMQAVLDTQFWLATHVVTVALGYATTALGAILGMVYLIFGVLTPSLNVAQTEKNLLRVIYGVLCFAIVFSFVGTVLGGLWADDSWGRFWGWDPKENGASSSCSGTRSSSTPCGTSRSRTAGWCIGRVRRRGHVVVVVRRQRTGRRPAQLRLHRRNAVLAGHLRHRQLAGHGLGVDPVPVVAQSGHDDQRPAAVLADGRIGVIHQTLD